ncbi:MAG: hypothetical protein KDA80_09345, partial [Planctomycetaceae bacterium]|nr:hypothetical protein [Planctomycetaceae bacterium]
QEISKKAKQETRQETASAGSDNSWLTSAGMQKAMKGVVNGLNETLKNRKEQPRDSSTPKRSADRSTPKPSAARKAIREAFSPLRNVAKSANDWVMKPPQRSSSGPSRPSFEAPSLSGVDWQNGLGLVAIGVLIGVCLLFLARRFLNHRQQLEQEQTALKQMAFQLRTREDVVRAYHLITSRWPSSVAKWWPHQLATPAMASAVPDRREPLAVLTELYEQARYLPPDAELTDAQIESARNAIQQCLAL